MLTILQNAGNVRQMLWGDQRDWAEVGQQQMSAAAAAEKSSTGIIGSVTISDDKKVEYGTVHGNALQSRQDMVIGQSIKVDSCL